MLVIGEGLGKESWLVRVFVRGLRFWVYTPGSASYMRGLQGFAIGAAIHSLPLVLFVPGQACNMCEGLSSVTLDQQIRTKTK